VLVSAKKDRNARTALQKSGGNTRWVSEKWVEKKSRRVAHQGIRSGHSRGGNTIAEREKNPRDGRGDGKTFCFMKGDVTDLREKVSGKLKFGRKGMKGDHDLFNTERPVNVGLGEPGRKKRTASTFRKRP